MSIILDTTIYLPISIYLKCSLSLQSIGSRTVTVTIGSSSQADHGKCNVIAYLLIALIYIAILPVDAKYRQQQSPGLEKLTSFSTITVSLYTYYN